MQPVKLVRDRTWFAWHIAHQDGSFVELWAEKGSHAAMVYFQQYGEPHQQTNTVPYAPSAPHA